MREYLFQVTLYFNRFIEASNEDEAWEKFKEDLNSNPFVIGDEYDEEIMLVHEGEEK